MCSDRRKNHGYGQKKPEGTSSDIFGVGTAAKCCELKCCADRVRSRTNNKDEVLDGKFVTWTFRLPPKRQLNILLNFFLAINILTFVSFVKPRVTMRFCAKNAGYSTGCVPPPTGDPVVRTDGRTDVWTDGHETITSLPKFLGLIGCQNWLSNGAPLARHARGLRFDLLCFTRSPTSYG